MTKFKLNDKVICITNFGVSNWLEQGQEYTVTRIYSNGDIAVNGIKNNLGWYAHRFELKQENQQKILQDKPSYTVEEKDMAQQTQQKTKRVPFTHELWERWKDKGGKVICSSTGEQVLQLSYFPEACLGQRYAYLLSQNGYLSTTSGDVFQLEIPVTTKRVPFNPELKDAKVFTTLDNQQIVDWVMFKDGQVACQWPNAYMGYYPTSFLEMEIEE